MGETTTVTLASVLTDITSVMTSLFAGIGEVMNIVMSNPILFIAVAIPIIGAVIGFTRRIFNI